MTTRRHPASLEGRSDASTKRHDHTLPDRSPRAAYDALDEALRRLAPYGPDLANGMTSHAPMTVEALCALGRPDAVMPWLERYRAGLLPTPPPREPIAGDRWCEALACEDRFSDWAAFFRVELAEAPWRDVLDRWVARLAPGLCAAATHGVIRVGHASRSLGVGETPLRLAELADALASWASTYQELPTRLPAARRGAGFPAREAIERVALVPWERRRFEGTIVSSLARLEAWPAFAQTIGLIDVSGDPQTIASELAETFALVYLANAEDTLTSIVFVHGVTTVDAVRSLLPSLQHETRRRALRFAWQAACGLYAAFGSRPPLAHEPAPSPERWETLVDEAIAHGDEHAIKLAAACRLEDARRPSPCYAAATRHAVDRLPRVP